MKISVLLNTGGRVIAQSGAETARDRIAAAFASLNVDATIELTPGADLVHAAERIVKTHAAGAQGQLDALAVGGGDGSIGTVAPCLAGAGLPLGVLPLGTLNHFAKDLGVPTEIEAAARVIAEGHVRQVDLAEVNGRMFVNNSSIGIYPYMVASRVEQQRQAGRNKWVAMILASARMLRRFPVHRLTIRTETATYPRKTPCAFVGNNMYALDPLSLGERPALDRGVLCVYVANTESRARFLVLTLQLAFGWRHEARDFELLQAHEVEIGSRARRVRLAIDGELVTMHPPLHFRIHPGALRVFAPRPAGPAP